MKDSSLHEGLRQLAGYNAGRLELVGLKLVQLANLWQADELRLRFVGSEMRAELQGCWDRRSALKDLASFVNGETGERDPHPVLCQLCALLVLEWKGRVVLQAASPVEGSQSWRLEFDAEQLRQGEAPTLERGRLVILCQTRQRAALAAVRPAIMHHLEWFCCSEQTRVFCQGELTGYTPISPRRMEGASSHRVGYPAGVWAFPATENGPSLPLGPTFSGVAGGEVKRTELSFGPFRVGRPGSGWRGKTGARTVLVLSLHSQRVPARAVWVWQGTEVAHQELAFAESALGVTLYLPLPEHAGWDPSGTRFTWDTDLAEQLDTGCADIREALKLTVDEFNSYRPGVESKSLAYWSGLALCSFAAGGLLAPMLGAKLALAGGAAAAVASVGTEYRSRGELRGCLGRELQAFADDLESTPEEQRLWRQQLLIPEGLPML